MTRLNNKKMADKQTAVEWLMDQLKFINKEAYTELHNESFEQAKEMHKDQLGSSFARGYMSGFAGANNIESKDFDQYYTENYEQNNSSEDPNPDHQG